jgi:hypothetical protein
MALCFRQINYHNHQMLNQDFCKFNPERCILTGQVLSLFFKDYQFEF